MSLVPMVIEPVAYTHLDVYKRQAKVSRDRYMLRLAQEYPQYELQRHKGYPTKAHYERLRQFGPAPIHRMSFLKKFFEGEKKG